MISLPTSSTINSIEADISAEDSGFEDVKPSTSGNYRVNGNRLEFKFLSFVLYIYFRYGMQLENDRLSNINEVNYSLCDLFLNILY